MRKTVVAIILAMACPCILEGSAWGVDFCVSNATELQNALTTAAANSQDDTIKVQQGTHTGNFIYDSSEGKGITLLGGYTPGCASRVADFSNTVLDGGGSGRVLDMEDSGGGDISIGGFTVQNGGGLSARAVSPSGTAGNVTIANNSITGNTGNYGGGVNVWTWSFYATAASDVILTKNTITGNTANTLGGGVYVHTLSQYGTASDVILTNNTITGNTANTLGGGVYTESYSTSGASGGIILTNNTITGNSTAIEGGGVYAYSHSDSDNADNITITNNTITGNTADRGGGLSLWRNHNTSNVYNNIIWGNTATPGGDIFLNGSGTANGYNNDYSDIFPDWTNEANKIDADPLFVDAAHANYHLQPSSPCIDAGTNDAPNLPPTDFEGDLRITDGDDDSTAMVDIGADEYTPPAVWYARTDGPDTNSGTSWNEAFQTIQKAVNEASAGDEIWVKQGAYSLLSRINVDRAIGIYGGFDGTETQRDQRNLRNNVTTVDGQGRVRCLYVTADATIDGFSIIHGGIYCSSSSPTITDCIISGNTANYYGGGIYCSSSSPTITNCTISDNSATNYGGGIYCSSSSPTITDCIVSGNTTDDSGGGIYCSSSSPTITNCMVSGNTTGDSGGGIYCSSSSPAIANCIISGNTAGYGGGISSAWSSPTITNCTISDNSATNYGGGVYCSCSPSSYPTITNCILWGNTPHEVHVSVGTPKITYCDIQGGYTGEGNIDALPRFVRGDDYHLRRGSPCIDAGICGKWLGSYVYTRIAPYLDYDGEFRCSAFATSGCCDIGADEYFGSQYAMPWIPLLLLDD